MATLSALFPYIRQAEDINDLQKWQGTQVPPYTYPQTQLLLLILQSLSALTASEQHTACEI